VHGRQGPEEAADLVQGFFAQAFERGFFERYDPVRARFRTWLRVCLDGYVSNQRQAARREKRGGGVAPLSLDFAGAEAALARSVPAADDPETLFEREWVRALLEDGLATLEARCRAAGKERHFQIFLRYDVHEDASEPAPSYADLAAELGLPVTQITNHLHWARREYRAIVLDRLRELTIDEREFRQEARRLLGRDRA
jgi:DNA-directed RNA polymerase specialized sigma24 family protein